MEFRQGQDVDGARGRCGRCHLRQMPDGIETPHQRREMTKLEIPTAPGRARVRAGEYISRGPVGEFGSVDTFTILAKDGYWEIRKNNCYAGWGWSLSDSLDMIADRDV